MYSVYVDNQVIYSPTLVNQGYIIESPVVTMELNKAGSFEFLIPPTNPKYSSYQKLKSIITIKKDDTEIWRGRVLNDKKDFYNNKDVFCEGELAFLNDEQVPPYDHSSGIGLQEYFNEMMSHYSMNCSSYRKIQAGTLNGVSNDVTVYRKLEDYNSVLSEITDKIIGILGGYFQIRAAEDGTRYLDYHNSLDAVGDQKIVFGENLIDIDEYIDASQVYTIVAPFGKKGDDGKRVDITSVNNGQNYISSSTGLDLFGHITKIAIWEDVEDPATLLSNATALLDEVIQMATTIELSAVDLELLGVDVESIQIGKFYRVQSPPHGIDSDFLCSKIVLNLMEPGQSTYTFGLVFSALTDQQVSALKKSDNAYKTSVSTADSYNSSQSEMGKNYVSTATFTNYQAMVERQFDDLEKQISGMDLSSYVKKTDFDSWKETVETDYVTKEEFNNLKQRVEELENEGGIS